MPPDEPPEFYVINWTFGNEIWALRRNLAERAIDGVFSDRGFSLDWVV